MATASAADWYPSRLLLPSGILSVLMHAVMLMALSLLLPLWDRPPAGVGKEPTRQIGIYVKEPGEFADRTGTPNSVEIPPIQTTPAATSVAPSPETPLPTTAQLSLPTPNPAQLIGPGDSGPIPVPGSLSGNDTVKPNPQGPTGNGVKGGVPGAAFMGLKDRGLRVVFVIDSSGSMTSHNAMLRAKAELISSVQALEPPQQFQVIFYNNRPEILRLKREDKPVLYLATEVNRTLTKQFVAGIQPNFGTQHLPALKMALKLNPDVIFLLTDADEPEITAAERAEIERLNQGRARIHCVEFGILPELNRVTLNFLQKLARENGGSYRYVDVTRPDSRP